MRIIEIAERMKKVSKIVEESPDDRDNDKRISYLRALLWVVENDDAFNHWIAEDKVFESIVIKLSYGLSW